MPITYDILAEQNVITETWTGEIQSADLKEHWTRYLADPRVMAMRRTIVDLRSAVILFKGADLDSLIRRVVDPVLNGRDWKTAIVVENPLQFGISRQYHVFASHYSEDAIFRTIEEAKSWLRKS